MLRFSLRRLFVLLGVLTATAAVVTSSAFAAPPTTPTTTCTSSMSDQKIDANLVVPAGAVCSLSYVEVTGNVSVQGDLYATGTTLDRNVNVTGGALYQYNQALTIKGNLAITGSAGTAYYGVNAFNGYPGSVVNGSFSYTGNSAPLYISNLTVKGNFNHSGNTSANQIQPGALTVLGNSTIA